MRMDYKYIEQLIERYWDCETSAEEEQILRMFFSQTEIPAHLLRYKSLFAYQKSEQEIGLGSDFDKRILEEIERPTVKACRLTLQTRFMPLFKAAAVIALIFSVGGVMKHSLSDGNGAGVIYVHDQFERRSTDPQVAYEGDSVKSPLEKVTEQPPVVGRNHKQ